MNVYLCLTIGNPSLVWVLSAMPLSMPVMTKSITSLSLLNNGCRYRDILYNIWYKLHIISIFKRFSSQFAVVSAQSIETRCWVDNEDVVGATPTGNTPTAPDLSTSLLPKVRLILDVGRWLTQIKRATNRTNYERELISRIPFRLLLNLQ